MSASSSRMYLIYFETPAESLFRIFAGGKYICYRPESVEGFLSIGMSCVPQSEWVCMWLRRVRPINISRPRRPNAQIVLFFFLSFLVMGFFSRIASGLHFYNYAQRPCRFLIAALFFVLCTWLSPCFVLMSLGCHVKLVKPWLWGFQRS